MSNPAKNDTLLNPDSASAVHHCLRQRAAARQEPPDGRRDRQALCRTRRRLRPGPAVGMATPGPQERHALIAGVHVAQLTFTLCRHAV